MNDSARVAQQRDSCNFYSMANEIAPYQGPQDDSTRTVVLFDEENPMCILNLLPDMVADRVRAAMESDPEYFTYDEVQLQKRLRSIQESPTAGDNRLKLKFWVEYDRIAVHQGKKKLVMQNVTSGVCTEDYFYKNYLLHPSRIAWLLCPPVGYLTKTKEALDFGMDKLREILDMPIIGIDGKKDLKLAALQVAITKMLDDRVRGAVVQKIEQKTMQVNVQASASEIQQLSSTSTMEELDRKLAELKGQDGSTQSKNKNAEPVKHSTNKDAIVVEVKHVADHK